jgi:pyruvyltransferase
MTLRKYFWWNPAFAGHPFKHNFGDDLFRHIAAKLLGNEPTWGGLDSKERLVFLGGSVLQFIRKGDICWGAGLRDGEKPDARFSRVDVAACRGRLTEERLLPYLSGNGPALGDPGILTAQLFPEWDSSRKHPVGFVPHFSDFEHFSSLNLPGPVIDPRQPAHIVVPQITECQTIVASSLHGIIVAEAFSIPAVAIETGRLHPEPSFKYEDYYSVTNRSFSPLGNLPHAISVAETAAVPNHAIFCQQLLEAFPKPSIIRDSCVLWENKSANAFIHAQKKCWAKLGLVVRALKKSPNAPAKN